MPTPPSYWKLTPPSPRITKPRCPNPCTTSPESDGPALAPFLRLLAQDIATHPERLQAIDAQTVTALQTLVQGVDVDLDALLPPDGPAASAPAPP